MVPPFVHVVATVIWLGLTFATVVPILDLFGGKTGAEGKDRANRRHRMFGIAFTALFALLFASMAVKFVRMGAPTPMAALHGLLAIGLVPMLILKIGIVRRWSTLARFLPALGMSVFCVSVVVAATGLLLAAADDERDSAPERAQNLEGPALVAAGRGLVGQSCSRCHAADRVYAQSGRKTRAEWTSTFDRMAARDARLERVRRPILAFLHAELASDPRLPGPADPNAPPPVPPPPASDDSPAGDDHGRGRGRGRGGR
jgi:hypothetical protein